MKHHFIFSVVTAFSLVILPMGIKAQETQQRRLHLTIEENGKVTKDTTVAVDRSLSEKEVQAIISGITGETPHPCPAHQRHAMQGDAPAGKCMHMKEVEIEEGSSEDSDIKVIIMHNSPGKEPVIVSDDGDVIIIRKGHGQGTKCLKETREMESDSLPCKKTKQVKVIISDEHADGPEWVEKKVIEKKVIVTEEGEKAEKTIILESPEKTKKAEKK